MISIDWTNEEEVMSLLKKWPKIVDEELRNALDVWSELLVGQISERTPTGSGSSPWGHLANAISAGTPYHDHEGWFFVYGTPVGHEYAEAIDQGRAPGTYPPRDAIREWIVSKAYVFGTLEEDDLEFLAMRIQHNIAMYGFKNHPEGWQMFKEGLEAAEPMLEPVLKQARRNIEVRASLGF